MVSVEFTDAIAEDIRVELEPEPGMPKGMDGESS
jgi:hypothetical protein